MRKRWSSTGFTVITIKKQQAYRRFLSLNLPYFTTANCDANSFATTQSFFNTKLAEIPGYARILSKLEESTNDCIALKNRELESVNNFLKGK